MTESTTGSVTAPTATAPASSPAATSAAVTLIVADRRGGPDRLHAEARPLRAPRERHVRVRVLAVPVCLPDVQSRYGRTPFPPRMPFTPGYAIVGDVDAVGRDVTRAGPGDRVAALTGTGGYSDIIELRERALIPVPGPVEPTEAAVIVLNYLVAYQTLHRVARVGAGDSVLIVGASGGIGTALLDLGRHAGLSMVGLASLRKHGIVERFGGTPVDYHRDDLRDRLRRIQPNGFHAVFDGVGGATLDLGLALLRRKGTLVSYANPGDFRGLLALLAKLLVVDLLPNGKTLKVYGTSATFANRRPLFEDWATLFGLLAAGAIHPVIHRVFPLCDAAAANAMLEDGVVTGNLVLRTPYGEKARRQREGEGVASQQKAREGSVR